MEPTSNARSHAGRRSNQEIAEIISEYETSGFSIEDYCEYKALNQDTFQSWLQKHANRIKGQPAFVSVNIIEDDEPTGTLFAEYKGLKFYRPMDVSFFKALIS
jgi:hypothetical protein